VKDDTRSQQNHSTKQISLGREKPVLNADYIVGLTDGEGSFAVHLNFSKRRSAKVEARFCLKLKAVDKPLLEEIANFFGCGKIYIQRDRRANHSLCYRFEVYNREELNKIIIPFFKKHPLRSPSKKLDFLLFSQIMEKVGAEKHLTEEGMQEITALKAQMHLGSLDAGKPLVQWELGVTSNYRNPPVTP
jgi:hypothetical protein